MKILWGLVMAFLLAGCAREDETRVTTDTRAKASVARDAIDGFTGRTAANAGLKAKATIESVNTKRKDDLDDILE